MSTEDSVRKLTEVVAYLLDTVKWNVHPGGQRSFDHAKAHFEENFLSAKPTPQHSVLVTYDLKTIRVVSVGVDPKVADDIIVQRKVADGTWEEVQSYNSVSDDFAHVNARDHARRLGGLKELSK